VKTTLNQETCEEDKRMWGSSVVVIEGQQSTCIQSLKLLIQRGEATPQCMQLQKVDTEKQRPQLEL
jgi:hypothetical protein